MIWLAYTFGAWFGAVLLHAVLSRLPGRGGGSVGKFLVAGSAWGFALAIWDGVAAFSPGAMAASLALFVFLCEFYIFLFTFVGSSISVSLLIGLLDQKAMAIAMEEGVSDSTEQMTLRRLASLEKNGFLESRSGAHVLTRKGRLFASAYVFFRHLFGHESA